MQAYHSFGAVRVYCIPYSSLFSGRGVAEDWDKMQSRRHTISASGKQHGSFECRGKRTEQCAVGSDEVGEMGSVPRIVVSL